jgi:hypothetical protein
MAALSFAVLSADLQPWLPLLPHRPLAGGEALIAI